jgi:prepilin-type N-terminal cleavage/methylation domain-containing protein
MHIRTRTKQDGFTLVEIAIVLVIVGLLLGGILKGQEMITQAKIKNIVSDFSGVSAAFYGYQDRYRAMPGDDLGAAARWAAAPAATAGNGNGVVEGTYHNDGTPCTAASESCLWWDHLRRAGFVAGSGVSQPLNAVSGIIGVETGDGDAPPRLALGGAAGVGGFMALIACSTNFPDKIAIAIDTQMDDGRRLTGTVRGQLQTSINPFIVVDATEAAAGGANSYVENGTNIYTLCRLL